MADVCVCTTQLERIVRGVKTSTTTPPGGLEAKVQLPSAEVKAPVLVLLLRGNPLPEAPLSACQGATATATHKPAALTSPDLKPQAARAAACATTAATAGRGLSVSSASPSSIRTHGGPRTTRRLAYVRHAGCYVASVASGVTWVSWFPLSSSMRLRPGRF